MRALRPSRLIPLLALSTSLACGKIEGLYGEVKALLALAGELQTRYHAPVNVSVSGSRMAITFRNAPLDATKLPGDSASALARDVATFAKAHYAHADQLEEITVQFSTETNTGIVTLTRSDAPAVFRTSELP